MKTKNEYVWTRVFSGRTHKEAQVIIPPGTPVEKGEHGKFWVTPSFFKEDAILIHDATYYGCPVSPDNVDLEEKSVLVYQVIPGIQGIYGARIYLPRINYADKLDFEKMKEAHLIARGLGTWGAGATSETKIGEYMALGYEFGKHEYEVVKAYLNRQGFKEV